MRDYKKAHPDFSSERPGFSVFEPFERSIIMESQTIQELEALTPTEMDAGLVFSGVPTGNTIWGYQNPCLYTPAVDPHYSLSLIHI